MKKDLNKIAKSIKGKVNDAVDSVKDVKIPDINIKDIKLPDIDLEKAKNIGQQVANKIQDGAEAVVGTVKSTVESIEIPNIKKSEQKPVEESIDTGKECISTRSAIKLFYFMMSADGSISDEELEKFTLVGMELDPSFNEHKEEILAECKPYVDPSAENYYATIKEGAVEAIKSSVRTADTFITPKWLIWDLLTIAYSDNSCDETERDLIAYVAEYYELDKAIMLEMESSILTFMDIEKEIAWIKTTDRPYLKIESMVNELEGRKNAIIEGVKALVIL